MTASRISPRRCEGARVAGADAGITVYDTSSAGEPLHERGRHVIVFAPGADGTRRVVEVYELENTGITTRVAAGFADPVWRAAIPEAASGFQAGESDVSAASIIGGGGKVDVFAPLAPGLKQVTFQYSLPSGAFPLTLPPARDSLVFEVLIEEPGADAAGAGLKRTDSVTVNGHHLVALVVAERAAQCGRDHWRGAAPRSHDVRRDGSRDRDGRRDARRAHHRTPPRRLTRAAARGSFDAQLNCGCGSRKPVRIRRGPATVTGT